MLKPHSILVKCFLHTYLVSKSYWFHAYGSTPSVTTLLPAWAMMVLQAVIKTHAKLSGAVRAFTLLHWGYANYRLQKYIDVVFSSSNNFEVCKAQVEYDIDLRCS